MIGRNNPFNIRYEKSNKWLGQVGETRGFCNFSTIQYGIRAAAYLLIVSYRKHGLVTYSQIIERFAPRNENDTSNYIRFVCASLHVFPFDVLSTVGQYSGVLHYMWIMEQGSSAWASFHILEVINHYKLKLWLKK